MEQLLFNLPKHLSSPHDLVGLVTVAQSLVFYIVFLVNQRWSFCPFSVGHYIVCFRTYVISLRREDKCGND